MYILGLESRISKGVENVSRGLMDYMIRGYPLKWGGEGGTWKSQPVSWFHLNLYAGALVSTRTLSP